MLLAIYLRAVAVLAGLLTPARRRVTVARGAGMLEYALLGGLAVVLYFALSGPLQGVVATILDNIRGSIGT